MTVRDPEARWWLLGGAFVFAILLNAASHLVNMIDEHVDPDQIGIPYHDGPCAGKTRCAQLGNP